MAVDGLVLNSSALAAPVASQVDAGAALFVFSAPGAAGLVYTISVLYEARADWLFLRKTLSVSSSAPDVPLAVVSISPFDALALTAASPLVGAVFPTGTLGTYGVFGRFADGSGLVAAATNPFLYPSAVPAFSTKGLLVHVGFHPSLLWNQTTAADPVPRPYVADAGLLGLYELSANAVPPPIETDVRSSRFVAAGSRFAGAAASHATDTHAGMLVEFVPFAGSLPAGLHKGDPSWLNYAERDAFRELGEAHFELPPERTVRVHIPWTENDYQVDIANATQWPEYVRILTMLSRIGVDRLLYAAANSDVSSVANCTDDWCWEEVLWLAEGEHLRQGVWRPGQPLAESVAQLIEVSQALGISAIPYVYPILGFTDGKASQPWLVPQGNDRSYSTLASREFQDFFIKTTIAFSRAMRSFGAGYDYTYLFDGASSGYSQWAGWRRILSSVRAALGQPGMEQYVVDNRQASHEWSPWMWAAGSYAEPLQSDEQTTSWTAYNQDIHIDRGDGNRQRQMNYDYAQAKLCQPSAMPGFLHHNTDRGDGRRTDLSIRDYDFFGAPYTILSAIATGGLNAVVCDIPARDEGEFVAFPEAVADNRTVSVSFYRTWFEWASRHQQHLRRTQFLPQPPGPGAIDGTYMMVNGSGFVWLFNPNSEAMTTPDGLLTASAASLDLICAPGDTLVVGELWPAAAPQLMTVPCGANFTVRLEARNARVLTIAPVVAADVAAVEAAIAIVRERAAAPPLFEHNQPILGMAHTASFAGGVLRGTVRVPQAVLDQLAQRAASYPVPWTPEDLQIAWLNPSRLLASIDVNRAVGSAAVITATLGGTPVPVLPCWSCRNVKAEMCFQGFFIDLSAAGVPADTDIELVLTLPTIAAGSFGGVYYENVDTVQQ